MSSSDSSSTFCGDARDKPSSLSLTDKQVSALNHLNCFLETHCVQLGVNVVEADAIPHHGIPKRDTQEEIFKCWDAMFGAVFTHMGVCARHGCDLEAPCLSESTADQCFCNKFRNKPAIPVFQKKAMEQVKRQVEGKVLREETCIRQP